MLARRTMRSLALVLGVCHTAAFAFTLGRASVRPATHAGAAVGERSAMGVPNSQNNQPRSGECEYVDRMPGGEGGVATCNTRSVTSLMFCILSQKLDHVEP